MSRDPAVTSRIMAAVRSRGGKADQALGSALYRLGCRYRRRSSLVGKPDFVFPSARLVVFVDGDFWHGRFLEERIARGDFKRNADYWIPKLRHNRERDGEVTQRLTEEGWAVLRFWESEVAGDPDAIAAQIATQVRQRRPMRQGKGNDVAAVS